jgi:hypothetical protein
MEKLKMKVDLSRKGIQLVREREKIQLHLGMERKETVRERQVKMVDHCLLYKLQENQEEFVKGENQEEIVRGENQEEFVKREN